MKKIKSTQEALTIFEEAAMSSETAMDIGDYKTVNKTYKLKINAINFLKKENSINELIPLLTHSSVGVRLSTATYLLPIIEVEATKVLEEIEKVEGIQSLNAEMTLKEWRNGNLKTSLTKLVKD